MKNLYCWNVLRSDCWGVTTGKLFVHCISWSFRRCSSTATSTTNTTSWFNAFRLSHLRLEFFFHVFLIHEFRQQEIDVASRFVITWRVCFLSFHKLPSVPTSRFPRYIDGAGLRLQGCQVQNGIVYSRKPAENRDAPINSYVENNLRSRLHLDIGSPVHIYQANDTKWIFQKPPPGGAICAFFFVS